MKDTWFITLLCLLALATSASAECAWVLWEENTVSRQKQPSWSTWTLHAASQTKAECEEALDKVHGGAVALIKQAPRAEVVSSARGFFAAAFRNEDGTFAGSEIHRFRCLPDTVDPRGPKGK